MRAGENEPLNEWLLDDHLGRLSEADRLRLGEMLRVDPDLAVRHRRLQRVLEPLDAWTTSPPPSGIVEKVLEAIAVVDGNATVARDPAFGAGGGSGYAGRRLVSLRDLIAVAAVIAFFFGVLAPSMSLVRERSRRVQCAANLSGISRGLAAYALANHNALPAYGVGLASYRTSFLPVAGGLGQPTTTFAPNHRSLFLLVKFRFVPSRRFVCPSQGRPIPLRESDSESWDDWLKRGRCSYDSINMAGPAPKFSYTSSQPYMADANPLFVGRKFNRVDPTVTSSPNHRKAAGQNVLFFDGSAEWCTTPNCGLRGDNIWQAGQLTVYKGTEVQVSADDTFLTP